MKGNPMRIRQALIVAAIVLGAVATAGIALATAMSPIPQDAPELVSGPPEAVEPSADTTAGIDGVLSADFSIESAPSDAQTRVSKNDAVDQAKMMWPTYAASAQAVTARHVIYTNKRMAALSDDQLAQMGVTERPKKLDAWMVTFHKVALRRHGPLGQKANPSADSNFVVVISSATGNLVEANGFGPVR